MEFVADLKPWFSELVLKADLSHDVRVYAAHVLARPRLNVKTESIVITHANAVSFVEHQKVGDDALWGLTMFPEHEMTVITWGQSSYAACYSLLRKRVHVYEELADDLTNITLRLRRVLQASRL